VDPLDAALLAELTVAVLHVALDAWLEGPPGELMSEVVARCFVRLRTVLEAEGTRVV
jgi:hypothetical protein